MPEEWHQFVMNLESNEADQVEAVLLRNGAHAVTLMDAGDAPVFEPAPGETPLWRDTRITALFDPTIDLADLRLDLQEGLNLEVLPPNRIERIADRVWEREWIKDFAPMKFGRRLWVLPWNEDVPVQDAVIVRLDPGLAFGTGTHPTTALCLAWLDKIDLKEKSVLDFGCGSGILGIAACKLGAGSVEGIDIDGQAVTASEQNALRNEVEDRFSANTELSDALPLFDIVVANILAGPLIENAANLCRRLKTGGNLALSGILSEQAEMVRTGFADWIEFSATEVQDNWVCLSGIKR